MAKITLSTCQEIRAAYAETGAEGIPQWLSRDQRTTPDKFSGTIDTEAIKDTGEGWLRLSIDLEPPMEPPDRTAFYVLLAGVEAGPTLLESVSDGGERLDVLIASKKDTESVIHAGSLALAHLNVVLTVPTR
jgi:hypothetical protein